MLQKYLNHVTKKKIKKKSRLICLAGWAGCCFIWFVLVLGGKKLLKLLSSGGKFPLFTNQAFPKKNLLLKWCQPSPNPSSWLHCLQTVPGSWASLSNRQAGRDVPCSAGRLGAHTGSGIVILQRVPSRVQAPQEPCRQLQREQERPKRGRVEVSGLPR